LKLAPTARLVQSERPFRAERSAPFDADRVEKQTFSALTAGCLEIRSLEVVQPGRDGANRAPARNVNVVVKLIERALQLRVTADAGADLDESGRRVDPMTMRRNVGEIRVRPARCDCDENRGNAGRESYSEFDFHQ
jgi:hypothetical protein